MYRLLAYVFSIIIIFVAANKPAAANDIRPVVSWDGENIPRTELGALPFNMFGDQIDPHLGGGIFSVVDVSLPGNFDIPVEIRRTIRQGRTYHPSETAAFGDWELDIP